MLQKSHILKLPVWIPDSSEEFLRDQHLAWIGKQGLGLRHTSLNFADDLRTDIWYTTRHGQQDL